MGQGRIRPELRFRGWIYRLFLPRLTPRGYRLANRFMDACLKGRWLGRATRMEQRFIPRPAGEDMRVCLCRSRRETRPGAAGLLWLHGGGYAMGLPEQGYRFIDRFAGDGGCVVVAPDYRRSTQAPYPAALEDAYTALVWMRRHARQLGIREDQLFVGGDSAGGGLTAALCLYARDRGEVAVAFQMPLYPMLDDRMQTASAQGNHGPVWDSRSNESAWRLYLSALPQGADPPIYAAPARADDLAGLPPACTFVGDIEPFFDETVAFVTALRAQGVPVAFQVYEGCFHAFDAMCPGNQAAREATAFLMERFAYAKERYFAGSGETATHPDPIKQEEVQP